ncbi:hypothetical protein F2Q69_00032554 [Brassica cretica]|uniref:O-fucosyltransferase family protein n=1 Tax=Brassica cretica TaxID=69181 RepID=A0A8S9RT11_BRACR|nr:hypothetical protein F2Q69_00032554 [Brassica cretica]
MWGPRLLKGWPCWLSHHEFPMAAQEMASLPMKIALPPKRIYQNNGYLMVSCNGGLNQMRAAICDMVTIARYMNVTLIVPELDKASFWNDPSEFKDIFDVDHFITCLRDEVRILKAVPPRLRRRVELGVYHTMPPVSWSNLSYYQDQVLLSVTLGILPLVKKHKVLQLNKTDTRLANNELPVEVQKLRCRVNFNGLRFTPKIEELGRRVVKILREKGPFLVLHLRYEMDMLAFSGCSHGCNRYEEEELTRMRYAYPWWKEKIINSELKRKEGLCPLTPEETASSSVCTTPCLLLAGLTCPTTKTSFLYLILWKQILPLVKKHKVLQLNKTDTRLANNELPVEVQKLRCRVNFNGLRFTPKIEELGRRVVKILREKGPFLVLHLRYEMDMLAFSGCSHGCNRYEEEELTRMRYAYPWWKEKIINSELKRKEGLCPLTPEETALTLSALGIDRNVQIYIAAGEIYGGKRRLKALTDVFPNVVRKETLLDSSDLSFCKNRSSQMAALDYLISLESDIFVPTYYGNMAKVVEGHRRFLGFKKTIELKRKFLVDLIDEYYEGLLSWEVFSTRVKASHGTRMGGPKKRLVIPSKPKEEDYFYANPYECLQLLRESNGTSLKETM